ncbi:MAG: DUF6308 family protein [Geodermatophilaceae bacterium]
MVSDVRLPRSLQAESDERAVVLLHAYYSPLAGRNIGFTGGQFDSFDPSSRRSASTNTITTDDLLSLSLLSTPVPGRAALELLDRQRRRFERLLEDLGPDRDLAAEHSVSEDYFAPAWALWRALNDLPGMGPTRVSKLMARKRPKLVPIFDNVLAGTVFAGSANHWEDLWTGLRESGQALQLRLLDVRERAGLDPSISALRVFDVCAWMDGTKNGDIAVTRFASS